MTIVVVALVVPEKPTKAAFPGTNGKIAFASDRDGDALTGTRNRPGGGYEATTIRAGRAGQDAAQ